MQTELSGSNEDPIATVGICSGDLVHLLEVQCPGATPTPDLNCNSRQSRHTPAWQDSHSDLSSDLLDHPASLHVAATAPLQPISSTPAMQPATQGGAGSSSQQLEAATAVPAGQPRVLACEPDEGMKAASEVRGWLYVGIFQSATDPCKTHNTDWCKNQVKFEALRQNFVDIIARSRHRS